jgi:hypothetical protein
MPIRIDRTTAAAIAAHRFGLGEASSLATVGHDATAWLLGQIGPAEPQRGDGLASGVEGLRRYADFIRQQRQAAVAASSMAAAARRQQPKPWPRPCARPCWPMCVRGFSPPA